MQPLLMRLKLLLLLDLLELLLLAPIFLLQYESLLFVDFLEVEGWHDAPLLGGGCVCGGET